MQDNKEAQKVVEKKEDPKPKEQPVQPVEAIKPQEEKKDH